MYNQRNYFPTYTPKADTYVNNSTITIKYGPIPAVEFYKPREAYRE